MKLSVLVLLPVVNFRVNLVMKSASSFSKTKGEAISKSFFMPITARYRVDKTEKRQPRRKGKHLRLHNVCPLLRHPQNDADLEPHPHMQSDAQIASRFTPLALRSDWFRCRCRDWRGAHRSAGGHRVDFLAMLLTVKFVDGLPLARFEYVLERHGVPVPRQTLARWVIGAAEIGRAHV